jgi:predicted TPR repeat methyltransferase
MLAKPPPSDFLSQADALTAAGEFQRAVALLERALSSGRGGLMTRLAFGRAYLAAGNTDAALRELRAAQALAPGIADAALALGEALMAAGHLPAAVAEFERAERLDPNFAPARYALGLAWLEAGEPDRALAILSTLAGTAFADEAAAKIALARDMKAANRSPPGYVRHLFDQFSTDYDNRMLGELNYRAHVILRELADLVLMDRRELDILDLGCGTGLTGAAFSDIARRLNGVDLSPRMIECALARAIYERLTVADLEAALSEDGPSYDVILAADTFVYVGDLGPALRGARRRLKPGGFVLFTTERVNGQDYELGPKRRYRHSEDYVRSKARRCGLDVMGILRCSPRLEAHQPVDGLAVALQRPPP